MPVIPSESEGSEEVAGVLPVVWFAQLASRLGQLNAKAQGAGRGAEPQMTQMTPSRLRHRFHRRLGAFCASCGWLSG